MAYKRSLPDWNENDDVLIRGLAFVKTAGCHKWFARAPAACRERAELLLKSGYQPAAAILSDALSAPVFVDDELPF